MVVEITILSKAGPEPGTRQRFLKSRIGVPSRHAPAAAAAIVFLIVVIAFLVLIILAGNGADGEIFYVDDDGSEDFTSIQDAIDSVTTGDTILVYNGTYNEQVVVNKTLILRGADDHWPLINGSGQGDVITINMYVNEVNVSGFSITGSGGNETNAGIHMFSLRNTISGNRIYGNNMGIYVRYSNLNTISSNEITDNSYTGLYLDHSDRNDVRNNVIRQNADGLVLAWSGWNTIEGNNISGNNHSGISIGADSSHCKLKGNEIHGNEPGIYITDCHDIIIRENYIHDNRITGISIIDVGGPIQINFNNITETGNVTGIGVEDNDDHIMNATLNWWGDIRGPYHTMENNETNGSKVTDNITFEPWLTKDDYSLPYASIISPELPNGSSFVNDLLNFSGISTGSEPIARYIWRSSRGVILYDGADSSFVNDKLPPGVHIIYLKVKDELGVWSDEVSITLDVVSRPFVNITSPTNNSKVSNILRIEGTARDDGGNIQKVEISFDGSYWISASDDYYPRDYEEWYYNWNLIDIESGDYNISARAFNGVSYSDIVTIKVTRVEPVFDLGIDHIQFDGNLRAGSYEDIRIYIYKEGNGSVAVDLVVYLGNEVYSMVMYERTLQIDDQSSIYVDFVTSPQAIKMNRLVIVIDPDEKINDPDRSNNEYSRFVTVTESSDSDDDDDDDDSPVPGAAAAAIATLVAVAVRLRRSR